MHLYNPFKTPEKDDHVILAPEGFVPENQSTMTHDAHTQVVEIRMLADGPFVFGVKHFQFFNPDSPQ